MPMVETSVAVATPSTTAARITKGSASAGSAMTKVRPISRQVARRTWRQVLAAIAPPDDATQSISPSTTPGSRPPVKSAAIETPVTEPMVMRTRLGGIVSVWAPVAESSATRSPGLRAALLHLREQHRRDRRHVRGLRARDAGDEIHRADEHVGEPAADMARAGSPESATIARAMPVISMSRPRKTNSGTASRMRCDMPSSMRPTRTIVGVLRGQREIAEGGEREREGDRHAGEDHRRRRRRRRRSAG